MARTRPDEVRDGVELTNLAQPLFEGAGVTKRDLLDYVDGQAGHLLPGLRDRPLSVIRVRGSGPAFMQKNLPGSAPPWIDRFEVWAEASQRQVAYALANDRRTLLWFANQRAVEYHVTLGRVPHLDRPTHLVIDLDPPSPEHFRLAVEAAEAVHTALREVGLAAGVKTSGAKGLHLVVPVRAGVTAEEAAFATRAIAARAEGLAPEVTTTAFLKADRGGKVFLDATRTGLSTVVAAFSPRARPGVPVSFPVAWADLREVAPADFTILTVPRLALGADPWAGALPDPQPLPPVLVDEGRAIPPPRTAALHEARRRTRSPRPDA